jgi:opacity protein-like surface antigen
VASTPELTQAVVPLVPATTDDGGTISAANVRRFERRFRSHERWIDPDRVRMGLDVCERLRVRLQGDVGGFDWGSASDFAWSAEAGLTVRVTDHGEAELAWLASGVDRDRGTGSIDAIQHGSKAGITYRF